MSNQPIILELPKSPIILELPKSEQPQKSFKSPKSSKPNSFKSKQIKHDVVLKPFKHIYVVYTPNDFNIILKNKGALDKMFPEGILISEKFRMPKEIKVVRPLQ